MRRIGTLRLPALVAMLATLGGRGAGTCRRAPGAHPRSRDLVRKPRTIRNAAGDRVER